jgi:monothiol glutaredoxin
LTSNPVANGIHPGATQEPSDGAGFTIAHPNEPPRVNQISARELKAMMDRGLPFELIDVRTEGERAIAKIEGSRLLNEKGHDYLLSLDRNTTIVFQCHHGIRSQSAAEYFLREEGFRNLYNLRGGIDAWSQLMDPSVPRY